MNIYSFISKFEILELISKALQEDIGAQDITTTALFEKEHKCNFIITANEDIIICGRDILKEIAVIGGFEVDFFFTDGSFASRQSVICSGFGDIRNILLYERVMLNFFQKFSGISTMTKQFVDRLNDDRTKILDTRKTTPGFRKLEKYACYVGGAWNHRFGLYDKILIKDNHISHISIKEAAEKMRVKYPEKEIEVECGNLQQVQEAIDAKIEIIMLDNMGIEEIKKAIIMINKRAKIEISGGVNLENIANYRNLDIDYISIGKITHGAAWIDASIDIIT